eukprot:gene12047-11840_t
MDKVWINAVGVGAALCSMTSFAPQIFKIWREKDASAVSLRMFALTVTGFVLWTTYGAMSGSWPLVLSNAVCLGLSAVILVDALTPAGMLAATEAFVAGGGTAVIANHNLHSLALLATKPELRDFFDDADLVQIDSVPMIAWARLVGLEVSREHRSTYLDWREDFWARAA